MRSLLLSSVFVLGAAAVALAASGVSPRFDGSYRAVLTPAQGMSRPACGAGSVGPVRIQNGSISVDATEGGATFDGFVTEEGFVTGHFKQGAAPPLKFEGRFAQGAFTGGVIADANGCAWLVRFLPAAN